MKMTETEARTRLAEGRLYDPGQEGILEEQRRRMEILYDYNATRPSETGRRAELLGKMLAEAGENCYIEPPFHANFGGGHVHFGNNVYANFNLTVVDDAHVYVGDDVQIGPNVTIATAGAPLDPAYRRTGMQFARGHSHRRRRLDRGREHSSSRRFRRSRFGDRRGQRGDAGHPRRRAGRPEIPAGCSGRSGRGTGSIIIRTGGWMSGNKRIYKK